MKTHFYDIESLDNVFTLCNYKPEENSIDVYCLCDDDKLLNLLNFLSQLTEHIHKCNLNFNGTVKFYNLHNKSANDHLAKTFGLSDAYLVNDPNSKSSYPSAFRPVCDTDPDYDNNKHPYLMGYNSNNYDTTMLALYFYEVYIINDVKQADGTSKTETTFKPITAKAMRKYNDELFDSRFKENMPARLTYTRDFSSNTWCGPDYTLTPNKIRKNMLMTGRHIDVAKLNEKQQKVGLKRLLGMLGYQILESDKLKQNMDTIENVGQLLDLIAYNVSDVVNLELLAKHDAYMSAFELKKGLLERYPELVYECVPNKYEPNIKPSKTRRDRLTINSSSAQFATKSLCPYGHLHDIPVVSFMYPSERKAKELGVSRVNVLDETKKFFYSHFSQPEIRSQFDRVYNYYKSIEGKNFNESDNYKIDYENTSEYKTPQRLPEIPKTNTCMCYYNQDGTPSSCFVTFSTGGIHGAEYNIDLFEADSKQFEREKSYFEYAKSKYKNPVDLRAAKKIIMPDGTERSYTYFLKAGATLKKAEYKDIDSKKPVLFQITKKGDYKLNPKYAYTSAAMTNHEDFTSYYPNLLRMMSAFYNEGLGYDRYAEIFDDKQRYGKLMKDKSIPAEKRQYYNVLRNGTKLILNSASGAGDATFESNIRMNNQIISMRIIGQLFSWRIGQAQTINGARIPSTNTDGLYSVLEESLNNKILEKESSDIGVEIEPEPLYLISKDTNNRIELTADLSTVINASGGTLSCRKGPTPTQSLAHPAITDWALTEYLIKVSSGVNNLSLAHSFDKTLGRNILDSAKTEFDSVKFLTMFQNVIASSPGSINYIFGVTDNDTKTPIILQHYNRVFIMKDKTPHTLHLMAANAKKLTPATISKRKRNSERGQQNDPIAMHVLSANGVDINNLPLDKEAVVKKITNIDETWYMLIENRNLSQLTENERQFIIDNLDYDKYLENLCDSFENNWRNELPDDLFALIQNGCNISLSSDDMSVQLNKRLNDIETIRNAYRSIMS